LAMAPKSNALYMACERCKEDIRSKEAEPVPLQLRNAPTKLMKELDYGEGYQYAHDTAEKITNMECFPESMRGSRYYFPTSQGAEGKVKERLEEVLEWKKNNG
ncbi:MAG: replication-associated recombination protein A, partial [Ruminococcus flavefaciens]|nr:replication-associated recombination protein A [Ruminococcus flavefaciens]